MAESNAFRKVSNDSAAFMKTPPHTVRFLDYWMDPAFANQNPTRCPEPAATRRMHFSEIKKAVNGSDTFSDGASIVQYTGHGNFVLWSNDFFFNRAQQFPDVNGLFNGTKCPG